MPTGVIMGGDGCTNTVIQGNYFGSNAAGTRQIRLRTGVFASIGCPGTVIGGTTPGAANYFTPKTPVGEQAGVFLLDPDSTVEVRVLDDAINLLPKFIGR